MKKRKRIVYQTDVFIGQGLVGTIFQVADNRITKVTKLGADLMGAAGEEVDVKYLRMFMTR